MRASPDVISWNPQQASNVHDRIQMLGMPDGPDNQVHVCQDGNRLTEQLAPHIPTIGVCNAPNVPHQMDRQNPPNSWD
tara:strand:- start:221 stop:454 length:234 start_codon:yes stop_codon:yes gene_type:complete